MSKKAARREERRSLESQKLLSLSLCEPGTFYAQLLSVQWTMPFTPGNMEAKAMVLQVDLVSMVTSDGHRQWQQWEGRSLSMRHYNNKGNLKVNRRTNHLKQQQIYHLPNALSSLLV